MRLEEAEAAQIIDGAMRFFDGDRYQLYCSCVMPNHAHAVLAPILNHKPSEILHSWKSYSAKEINKVIGGSGSVWQDEYYDHLVRDPSDFNHCCAYVLSNPSKANLLNRPWVYSIQGQDAP